MRTIFTFDEALDVLNGEEQAFYYDTFLNEFVEIENDSDLIENCYNHDFYYSENIDKN